MKIGIIGTGRMGTGLGQLWLETGHGVLFGSRDPAKARAMAESIGGKARGGSNADAAAFGEVVVLSVPGPTREPTLRALGAALDGKILLDITNVFGPDGGLLVGHTTSGAEQVQAWASRARVVKAFNTIYFQNLDERPFGDQNASLFVCGDDADARAAVLRLGADIGFDPVDCGPLENARLLEPLALLWIRLAFQQGLGSKVAFKLLRR